MKTNPAPKCFKLSSLISFSKQVAVFSLALTILAAVFPSSAKATPISPGPGAFPPDLFSFPALGPTAPTLLASTSTNFTSTNNKLSGSFLAAVYSDPTTGGLDFIYQVTNSASSGDSVGRVTGIDFTGFLTDVGYTPTGSTLGDGFVNGTVPPQLVDRVSADTVGFSFNAPLTQLVAPGQTSTVLVIETNATQFTAGHANLIDGGVSTVDAFEPTTVPEASTFALLALGSIGLVGARRALKAS